MKTKSKSKTFPKGTNYSAIAEYLADNIKCRWGEDLEIGDTMIHSKLTAKYIVTVTKVEDAETTQP